MNEYDRIAGWYAGARGPEAGVPEVTALAAKLEPGARVLDAGCGTGLPLARLLVDRGCAVVGLDASTEMLARFRANVPEAEARLGRVEAVRFAPGTFDAVVAWGVLFHLPPEKQAAALRRVAQWLRPGGWLLFTSGDVAGERRGEMHGRVFRYWSLDEAGYRRLLARNGLCLAEVATDARDNVVYLARRVGKGGAG
ncbi:class I SAM-dependent methyltransferase [Rhodocaloribacter litoris]|uniref:class I SAM-dependent methyltransferase n=1 Tax=Rhodocaloribacter litoris TaxID=2558931 RepID=UPI00141DD2F4|nr:class I SAM-dependent methyltransferase [Rhodocaloribacter litoris]QXD14127.1 class I SAM-dependent methyltransferase [Rhodocaloribacter litoris]